MAILSINVSLVTFKFMEVGTIADFTFTYCLLLIFLLMHYRHMTGDFYNGCNCNPCGRTLV